VALSGKKMASHFETEKRKSERKVPASFGSSSDSKPPNATCRAVRSSLTCPFEGGQGGFDFACPLLSETGHAFLTSSHIALSAQNLRRRPRLHLSVIRLLVRPQSPTITRILNSSLYCCLIAIAKLPTLGYHSQNDYWTISHLLAGTVSESV
jgi:hypothetical protein